MPCVLDREATEVASEAGPEPCVELDGGTPSPGQRRAKIELVPPPPAEVAGGDHAVEDRTAEREAIVEVVDLEREIIGEPLIIERRDDIGERIVADRRAPAP